MISDICNDTETHQPTPFLTSFVVVWYFLISLATAAISDQMGVIGRMPRMLSTLLSPGRGLLLHSSAFYSVGVCVQVAVGVLRDTQGRVNSRLHRWRGLWKVHTGAWPPARASTSVIHTGNIPPAATAVHPRARECVCLRIKALPEPSIECPASAMFISHSFSISLLESQCLFVSIQWILAQSSRTRKTGSVKNSSDSGRRWRVDVGGQVWLPDVLLHRSLVSYLLS